jgi:mannitol/fructose-specific phosphotransferase system IIA component (Ntr-type)
MIRREDFIKRKMALMCQICYRRIRLIEDMMKNLPEEGTLDELEALFNDVLKREALR